MTSSVAARGLALLLLAAPAAAADKPRATLIGHATVLLEGTEATLLTDPFFKDRMLWLKRRTPPSARPADLPPVDAVLVSHTHPDHFDRDAILALSPRPVVVMPWGRGRTLRRRGVEVVALRPWETWTFKNVKVTAVPARHNAWHNLGYLIEMDGRKLYFTGDTKLFRELEDLRGEQVDMMLMPYDGTPVIGNIWAMSQAAEAVRIVSPRVCVPVHAETFRDWLTGRSSTPPAAFIEKVRAAAPQVEGWVLKAGESVPLTAPRGEPVSGR